MTDVVFSRRQAVTFSPLGPDGEPVERSYTVAPLTVLENAEYRVDLMAMNAFPPPVARMLEAYREAAREIAPANLADVLAVIDEFEAVTNDADATPEARAAATRKISVVEAAVMHDAAVSVMVAKRLRFNEVWPYVKARHSLRGWSGPGLPAFRRVNGRVPDALLDAVPEADLLQIAIKAEELSAVGEEAEKNSAPPSQSSGTPTPSTAD